MTEVKTVGVIGAGQMGNGIAHVLAQAGYTVLLQDLDDAILARATETIARNMAREVKREAFTEQQQTEARERITTTTDLSALAPAQLIVEAVSEREALKLEIYGKLATWLTEQHILASNTSSISITRLGAATPFPDRFVGLHFFNPVPMMPLVEVIAGMATAPDVVDSVEAVTQRAGKTACRVQDAPGFAVNRVLIPMLNEACFAVQEGVTDVATMDTAMRLGLRHPMGPFMLADYIGLDTVLAVARVLHEELGDPRYRPCSLLVKHVEAGWLGVKNGRGFYDHSTDPPTPLR